MSPPGRPPGRRILSLVRAPTDNTEALQNDAGRSRAILERIPAGRWRQAGDIAGAPVFLASAASDYVSGITLPVDGGWLGR
jgi:2-deoxy-D-gluconate 3-dehydrogenase